jgi:phosphinothricin acetyltransferase
MIPRLATPDDAAQMAAIYNVGMEDRAATFETRARSTEDVRGWFDRRHPIVVVEQDGEIVAFASTSTYRPRECYSGIAEVAVYAGRKFRRRGAGRVALDELIKQAKAQKHGMLDGVWRDVVAQCSLGGTPSVSLRRCSQWRGSRGKNRE